MKRVRQSFEDIYDSLMPVEASWMDDHAEAVIQLLKAISDKKRYDKKDLEKLLDQDFAVAFTTVRLFADISKDEFIMQLKDQLGAEGGTGVKRYREDKSAYLKALANMGVVQKMTAAVNRPLHWSDTLIERLKGGRGSAIKGQKRGRGMEDFVEEILLRVFSPASIAARCRFTGAGGESTEKADFAIPNATDPHILIEVKAYGATGSKQTDVLGDISRIVDQKRNDTDFFLVTDGITWRERPNDLRKLIALQNQGAIRKIYTKSMADELEEDLVSLKSSHGL